MEGAIKLIREPECWTQGAWRCVIGESGHGTPAYAYCLDGAVGEAALAVLGFERASALQVVTFADDLEEIPDGRRVCSQLSVSRLAYDLLVKEGDDPASTCDDDWQITYNDTTGRTHAEVLALLRRKAKELRAKVKALDARRAV